MSYLPRDVLIDRIGGEIGHDLIAPERIDDQDLRAIWDCIEALTDELNALEEE